MKRPKPISGLRQFVKTHRPAIKEILREPTAGGIVYRKNSSGNVELLLIQDSKGRWTIPKGHIEEGETPRQTAEREIGEETGLKDVTVQDWLGKINFRYRRGDSLVLITQEIFLIKAEGKTNNIKAEDWMKSIGWLPANEALDKIEYEDIGKLILLGLKKIRDNGQKGKR
ncbi:MAG TPA: NUDIX domain-containing protein [Candidatus Babeliales bacterium]|jgi:8-oxo-dGTP pyrophosphatase MutT (NUDIX family)|nr:NUDIX domain-containing protein [Candidatus Babeliales bacterium]